MHAQLSSTIKTRRRETNPASARAPTLPEASPRILGAAFAVADGGRSVLCLRNPNIFYFAP